MPRITRQSLQLTNVNPVIRTLFTLVSAQRPLEHEMVLTSIPAPDNFTCLLILRWDHEQDPPGTLIVSPSVAEFRAALTADSEQFVALTVAAPPLGIGKKQRATGARTRRPKRIFISRQMEKNRLDVPVPEVGALMPE